MKRYQYKVVTSSTDFQGTVDANTASEAITKVLDKHPGTMRHQVEVHEVLA